MINNEGDFMLTFRSAIILQESEKDERAFADEEAAAHAYLPYLFFDPQSSLSATQSYERATAIYLRPRAASEAMAKLNLTYSETACYVYFTMLKPRSSISSLVLNLYWRAGSGTQLVQALVTFSGRLEIYSQPNLSLAAANYLPNSSLSLPRIRITVPMSALRNSTGKTALEFRAEALTEFNPSGYWPSAVSPNKWGKLLLQEAPPNIYWDATEWQVRPHESQTRFLHIAIPSRPWSKELQGGLVLRLVGPFYAITYIPFQVQIENFRPWFDPDSVRETDPDTSSQEEETALNDFRLQHVYPNPFSLQSASIAALHVSFYLPKPGHVRLEIFNLLGHRVALLLKYGFTAGRNTLLWEGISETGERLRKGLYFIRLVAGSQTAVRKLVILD